MCAGVTKGKLMSEKTKNAMKTAKAVVPAVVLGIAAVLFFLYALGFWDFTFIDRPATPTEAPTTETVVTEVPTEPASEPVTDAPATEPPVTDAPATEHVIRPASFPDVNEASKNGYYLTTYNYDGGMILAELRTLFEYTNDYSLRNRYWYKATEFDDPLDDLPPELDWVQTEEPVPAVEAYMGWIFADNGNYQDVYDSYGNYIGDFNPNHQEYAYKRDTSGTPLFRSAYNYYFNTKDDSQSSYKTAFHYFNFYGGGGYSDITNNRGLMADYPATYGVRGDTLSRKVTWNNLVETTSKGRLRTSVKQKWQFMWGENPAFEETYSRAMPYSEGYACVADETGVMYFIDTYGRKTFETRKETWSTDFSTMGRQVVEQLLFPLDESKALGCYYFDHGLVMARKQIYDYYQLKEYKIFWVMSDKNVILYADGTEYPLPTGFEALAYSDGVITMKRGDVRAYIDYTGAWVGDGTYEDAKPFMEGLGACKKDGAWGLIDTAGNVVLPFIYDSVQSPSSGVIVCHSPKTGWHVYLKMCNY